MWDNTFETEPYGRRGMYFYEPLDITAPADAYPYCCLVRHVYFYKQNPAQSLELWGEVQTKWDLLGERWTDEDIGWNALSPLVRHAGEVYELGGGQAVYRDGRWYLQWLGWRLAKDDRRWPYIKERMTP